MFKQITFLLIALGSLSFCAQEKDKLAANIKTKQSLLKVVTEIQPIQQIITDYLGPVYKFKKKIPSGTTGSITSLSFSPDGLSLASGLGKKPIKIWDADELTENSQIMPNGLDIIVLIYAPNGVELFGFGNFDDKDSYFRVFNTLGRVLATVPIQLNSVSGVAHAPHSVIFAVAGEDNDQEYLVFWDGNTKEIKRLRVPQPIVSLGYSPDGKYLVTGQYKKIVLRDPKSAEQIEEIGEVDNITGIGFLPDHNLLVYARGDEGAVWFLNLKTKQKQYAFSIDERITALAVKKNGSAIAVGDNKGNIHLYTLTSYDEDAPVDQENLVGDGYAAATE